MTFQQLQYILEIGNTGSISGAAKKLFVSPSSVSVCLNILEKELGYPLFDRAPNCFKPTPEGRLVLDYAQQICSTHQLLNNVGRDEVRTVRINCTDQPPVAKAFTQLLCENRHRTDLRIENIHCQHNEIYPMLATRQLDVSLSSAISYAAGNWIKTVQQSGLHLHVLKTVPAVIYLDTAEYLLVAEDAVSYVDQLRQVLKPTVKVCVCQAAGRVKETVKYLEVHSNLPKLSQWKAGVSAHVEK